MVRHARILRVKSNGETSISNLELFFRQFGSFEKNGCDLVTYGIKIERTVLCLQLRNNHDLRGKD